MGVEVSMVKTCPHCDAQVRPSVIRCTSCGKAFDAPVQEGGRDVASAAAAEAVPSPAPASAATATATAPKPGAPGVWVTGPAPAVKPQTATPRGNAQVPNLAGRRALPTQRRRSNHPDLVMILAAFVALFAAYSAWSTIALRWVQVSLSRTGTEGEVTAVGTATFRASEAMSGTLAQAVLVVIAASAVLWLFFGLQRGWTIPWFASPAIAIVAAVIGLVGTVLASVLWFVWRDTVLENASRFATTRDELTAIFEDVERSPIVELQRLGGPGKFGTMLAVALAASCIAWWAYRKRLS